MARDSGVLVIFDLVSTLTDAAPRYVQAFAEVLEKHGVPAPAPAEVTAMLGNKNLSEITDHFVGPLQPADKKQFMADCNTACDILLTRPGWREHLFPHVREAIETMKLRGLTLGIYTGTREDALAAQLGYHKLQDLFDARYLRGKDNTRDAGKKNDQLKADQLISIVNQFRVDQGGDKPVIVIGDSSADAAAAASLGLYFIGFAADDKKLVQLQQAGVRAIIRDFGDLPDLIDRLQRPAANDSAPKPGLNRKFTP